MFENLPILGEERSILDGRSGRVAFRRYSCCTGRLISLFLTFFGQVKCEIPQSGMGVRAPWLPPIVIHRTTNSRRIFDLFFGGKEKFLWMGLSI